jgi:hypothetical protein
MMPHKRKQQGSEVTTLVTPSPPKRVKLTPTDPKQEASEDAINKLPIATPANKAQYKPQPKYKAMITSLGNSAAKHTTAHITTTKSRLVPRGERKSATIGQKNESLLRMLCDDTESGELKELHFRNMLHSRINWNDVGHINKINNWRNQIYGRAGMKTKAVTLWLYDEELWFELYYQVSIAESRTRGILLPKTLSILEAFNQTFVGQVIQDSHGDNTEPRIERQPNAFASKFNRVYPQLRARLNQCVFGKSGDVFVPKITFRVLQTYKQMKAKMDEKGIKKESAYSEKLEEWQHFFSHLPDYDDVEILDEPGSSVEDHAAAVLISMASQSFDGNETIKTEGEEDVRSSPLHLADHDESGITPASTTPLAITPQQKHAAAWPNTPELSYTPSYTSSQRSDGLVTPLCNSFFTVTTNYPIAAVPKLPRCATPKHELDVSSLIASPD